MFDFFKIIIILALLLNSVLANNIHFKKYPRLGQSSLWAELSNNQGVVNFIMENSQLQLNFNEEVWKDVKGYEGLFQVSNKGIVKSYDRYVKHSHSSLRIQKGRTLNLFYNKDKYRYVTFELDGVIRQPVVHRLVAIAFIPNPDNKPCVNHIDCNKSNNKVENLEWCTPFENTQHAKQNNLLPTGEKHGRVKLTEIQVLEIRKHHTPKGMYNTKYFSTKYCVSTTTINFIVSRKIWKHV
jgi:hypothetical protein